MSRPLTAALLFALTLSAPALAQQPPTPPAASDAAKGTARDLTIEGYALLDKGDFAGAADRFKRADALFHAPTIVLGLGRAYLGLGKLTAAQEAFSRTAHETLPPNASAAFTSAVADAQKELLAIAPRVPGVIIKVVGPAEPKVTVDGVDVPAAALGAKWPVDPGKHTIKAGGAGFAAGEASFTVAEGKVETVTLTLNASKEPPSPVKPPPGAEPQRPSSSGSTRRTMGIAGMAAGGAGLALGAVMGGLVIAKHGDLATKCTGGVCGQQYASELSTYHAFSTVSTVGFIAGGALAAAGVVLFATAPKAAPSVGGVRLTPLVGPGWAGLEGRFR